MQKIFFLVLVMFSGGNGFTQSPAPSYSQISKTPFFNSHDFIANEDNIEGSALLFEKWRSGKIILKNHKEYNDVLLNFIPSANKFYINQHDTIRELVVPVEEIRIKDVNHPDDKYYDRKSIISVSLIFNLALVETGGVKGTQPNRINGWHTKYFFLSIINIFNIYNMLSYMT